MVALILPSADFCIQMNKGIQGISAISLIVAFNTVLTLKHQARFAAYNILMFFCFFLFCFVFFRENKT